MWSPNSYLSLITFPHQIFLHTWQPQQLATVEVVASGRAHGSSFTTVCDDAMKKFLRARFSLGLVGKEQLPSVCIRVFSLKRLWRLAKDTPPRWACAGHCSHATRLLKHLSARYLLANTHSDTWPAHKWSVERPRIINNTPVCDGNVTDFCSKMPLLAINNACSFSQSGH